MKKLIGILCLFYSFLLFGITTKEYVPRLLDYKENHDLYEDMRKKHVLNKIQDDSKNNKDKIDQTELVENLIEVDHKALSERNEDYIGWLYIPDTNISYPVVRSSDNADYLHTDYDGEYSFAGTVFADKRCDDEIMDHHMILYGHNMRNGSMFADIKKFHDEDFVKAHPYFWFLTPNGDYKYQIFSVATPFAYDSDFYNVEELDKFSVSMNKILKSSVFDIYESDIKKSDYIMTLSTCTQNEAYRNTIHGILV